MNHNNFMTMKNNYQKVLLWLTACLLLTLFAVSCTKEKEESLLKHVSRHGTIDVSGISTSGMLVNSFCGESQVKKNDFDLDMPQEAQLNTITVTNGAGSVMLLYRDKADADIVINIQSTALALVTMHPLFAPILGDDFERLKSLINMSSRPALSPRSNLLCRRSIFPLHTFFSSLYISIAFLI